MLLAPELLANHHYVNDFESGMPSLDNWLKHRAAMNQVSGASRTYVTSENNKVIGYYALASSAINAQSASGRLKRNMPDPIPVIVLARLAVSRSHHGKGIGKGLFQDVALRIIHAADTIGIRGIIVHAISDKAKAFYMRLGLTPSPIEPMTLMVTLADLKASL